jgi:dihydrolipoamide dehydrogenase
MESTFDLAIIGGGPGGYLAAIRAAQLGGKVALVEMERIGGTCLNRGCIPTKTLFRNVEAYLLARRAGEFGVTLPGNPAVDFRRMIQRKNEVVNTLVEGVMKLLSGHRVQVYDGVGTILGGSAEGWRVGIKGKRGPTEVEEITARKVIIATGSVPSPVPMPGGDLPGVLTSRELLDLDHLPESMVIIGASVVGTEFASMFGNLGTKVTLLGRRTFLKDADEQLAARYKPILMRQGVTVDIGLEFKEIRPKDTGLEVVYDKGGVEKTASGEIVLSSAGRWPYTDGLGLEALGIARQGRGIAVDEYLETNRPGIYAIGDVTGRKMLAHVAYYEGMVAAENAMGARRKTDYRVVPECIFTMPEIADVGLTERQAKEADIPYKVGRFPFSALGKALAVGETAGQVRIVCQAESGRVIGMHAMGPHASDIIAEGAMAMRLGATAQDIADTIHAHPTLPEATMEAALGVFGEPIHYRTAGGG